MAVTRNGRHSSDRRRKFVKAYVKFGIAEKAAIEAGYSESYAAKRSHELVEKCREEIEALQAELREAAKIEAQDLIAWWRDVMHGRAEPDAGTAARLKASELIGKVIGAFTEKREVSVQGQFVVALPEPEDDG